jgi:hypothetical protein
MSVIAKIKTLELLEKSWDFFRLLLDDENSSHYGVSSYMEKSVEMELESA